MPDDDLLHRIADAVMAPPDPERDRELEDDLADRPELLRELEGLRAAWEELRSLSAREPPEGARERAQRAALAALEERSGEAPGARGPRWRSSPVLGVAAAVLIFLAGGVAGAWAGPRLAVFSPPGPEPAAAPVPDGRPRFALLIRGGDLAVSEADAIEAMAGWARELWSNDQLLWAERFAPDESVWVGDDRPDPDGAPEVGGLFIIQARDRDEAVRLARESPPLDWGGVVEVLPSARSP